MTRAAVQAKRDEVRLPLHASTLHHTRHSSTTSCYEKKRAKTPFASMGGPTAEKINPLQLNTYPCLSFLFSFWWVGIYNSSGAPHQHTAAAAKSGMRSRPPVKSQTARWLASSLNRPTSSWLAVCQHSRPPHSSPVNSVPRLFVCLFGKTFCCPSPQSFRTHFCRLRRAGQPL